MTWPNSHALGGIPLDLADGSRIVTKVTGVDGSATIRNDLIDRTQQSGQWDSQPLYGARVIQVEGVIEEATSQLAHATATSLRALGLLLNQFTVVSAGRGTVSTMVRVQSGLEPDWIDDVSFTYVMTLVAPDPILYGPPTFAATTLGAASGGTGLTYPLTYPLDYGTPPGVVAGGVSLANAGSTSYHPRLRIDGGVTNPRLTLAETGDTVVLNYTIPAGQWVDFNAGKPREVLLNGQVSLRHLTTITGNALAVPVGGGSLTWSADGFTASHSLSVWGFERADQ